MRTIPTPDPALVAALEAAVEDRNTATVKAAAVQVARLRIAWDDLKGETPEYLSDIAAAYRMAGVPSDSKSKLQANLRYHVGNVIRTMVSAEALAAAGLDPEGPAGRARRARGDAMVAKLARMPRKAPARKVPAARPAVPALDPAALLTTARDLVVTAARILEGNGDPAAPKVGVAAWAIERAMGEVTAA